MRFLKKQEFRNPHSLREAVDETLSLRCKQADDIWEAPPPHKNQNLRYLHTPGNLLPMKLQCLCWHPNPLYEHNIFFKLRKTFYVCGHLGIWGESPRDHIANDAGIERFSCQ
jgi:hypothetical protein